VSSAPPDDEPGGLVQRTIAALNERLRRYEGRPLVDVALRVFDLEESQGSKVDQP
jgi:hypothetical protein